MKTRLVLFLKNHPVVMDVVSFCFNLFFSPSLLKFYFDNKHVCIKGTFLKHVKIKKIGEKSHTHIYIGPKTLMKDSLITVEGDGSCIMIEGRGTNISNSSFVVGQDGSKIVISSGFTTEGCRLKAHEGKTISIGQDCMFSAGINMSTTDFHPIVSLVDGTRLNSAKDVVIGNHVWLARNVSVLKGCSIADDVIIGMNSIATGNLSDSHAIYVGNPIRKLRDGVSWRRSIAY